MGRGDRACGDSYQAERWRVSGRVQGVGFRYFCRREAARLGLDGWVKNLDDGAVEVHAQGTPDLLKRLTLLLREGPAGSDVTAVGALPATLEKLDGFSIR